MKALSMPRRLAVLAAGLFILCSAVPAAAQNFKPFTFLRFIETEHFRIIFPKESESTARTLSQYADGLYERISSLLGITVPGKIPVTITPHTDQFNGYMNSMPYPHIVLFDTPMDPEWTVFENSLKSLFLHELTHAVSLSSRGPFLEALHRIFGGWVYPAGLNAPLFMVEGVTVSFESLDGFGRANDPVIKQKLRQAIHEGKFLTPFQVSGVYDLPPDQAAYYEYGGLFSAYLQDTYGMEKYASLWQAMGRRFYLSPVVYNSGYYHLFTAVYGITFTQAWDDFQASLALQGLKENSDIIPLKGPRPFIDAMAAGDGRVFLLDRRGRKILAYDPAADSLETLGPADSSAYYFGISHDGKYLLVSGYRYADSLAAAAAEEYRTDTGRRTGRSWKNLYKAGYFRKGLIGIGSDLHANTVVYQPFSGEREILFAGSEELVFSNPCAIDDSWIAFVAVRRGIRELCVFNYDTKQTFTLHSSLEDDAERWRYIRDLRVSGGRIFFSYNHDDRMYKLGIIDVSGIASAAPLGTVEAFFGETDFSGGVFSPVAVNGEIYYRGAFASRDGLLRYPGIPQGTAAALEFRPWEGEAEARRNRQVQEPPPLECRKYFAIRYLNPFKLWLPTVSVRYESDYLRFGGVGIASVMIDPTDTNTVILQAAADIPAAMAMVDVQWQNLWFGIPLTVTFSDKVDRMTGDSYRATRAGISGSFSRGMGNERNYLSLSAGVSAAFTATNPKDGSSAYTWGYDESRYSASLGIGLTSLRRQSWQFFGDGISGFAYGRSQFSAWEPRFDGIIRAGFESRFPLGLSFYGAWDETGMDLHGKSRTYGGSHFDSLASSEYPAPGSLDLTWLAGGEMAIKIFSLEIQKNLSHLYFNRFYAAAAYRAAVYDSQGHPDAQGTALAGDIRLAQSAILRIAPVISLIPIKAVPISVEPSVWGAWKLSNTLNKSAETWTDHVMFGFSLSLGW
ncbi:hypothetical protein [Breznakiella homolactica]|uniref:Uncharacterized protein n=1 Tax=Breznakiella homolactica TaxID=2798577 RepID=A0A7T7XNN3_9SPIR|nr:hypothetical protein [Breznakiella homolactica]QQO09684.1 hypothetical protein JFL75_01835 [Breznakiella homolactica]